MRDTEIKSALEAVLEHESDRVVIFPNKAPGELVAFPFAFYGAGPDGYCDGVEFWLAFTNEGFEETFGTDMPKFNRVWLHNNPDTDIIAFGFIDDQAIELSPEQQQKFSEIVTSMTEDALLVPNGPLA